MQRLNQGIAHSGHFQTTMFRKRVQAGYFAKLVRDAFLSCLGYKR